jgi:hypothetical protein
VLNNGPRNAPRHDITDIMAQTLAAARLQGGKKRAGVGGRRGGRRAGRDFRAVLVAATTTGRFIIELASQSTELWDRTAARAIGTVV